MRIITESEFQSVVGHSDLAQRSADNTPAFPHQPCWLMPAFLLPQPRAETKQGQGAFCEHSFNVFKKKNTFLFQWFFVCWEALKRHKSVCWKGEQRCQSNLSDAPCLTTLHYNEVLNLIGYVASCQWDFHCVIQFCLQLLWDLGKSPMRTTQWYTYCMLWKACVWKACITHDS